jgi:hypothetical protein
MKIASRIINAINEKVLNVNTKPIMNDLKSAKSDIVDQNLGNLQIASILNNKLRKHRITFTQEFGSPTNSSKAEVGLIGGATLIDGSIEVHFMDSFYETFEDDYLWDEFIIVVEQIIEHELVHREQFKRIKNPEVLDRLAVDPEDSVEYYSSKIEQMAMAKQAVKEFQTIGYENNDILKRVKQPFSNKVTPGREESDVFWNYTELFYPNDKALKGFLKYMYGYLR